MQGPGTEGMRHSAFASIIGSERFDTPHLRHEPGGAFAFDGKAVIPSEQRESRDLHCESLLLQPLIDNRWSRKNTQHMQDLQHRGAPSAGVTWCNEQRRTRLPLLGASAVTSRRRRTTLAGRSYVAVPPARARCRTHLASEVALGRERTLTPSYATKAPIPAIRFHRRVVAQLVRAGEVPRRSLVRTPGRRIEGYLTSRTRVRFSPALPVFFRRAWALAARHRAP